MPTTIDVLGLGNTLMDFVVEVEDNVLLEFNVKKGEMHLVEELHAKRILKEIERRQLKIEMVPGGSVANTIKGVAFLGGSSMLYGKVGDDPHGLSYIQQMQEQGVKTRINHHSKLTGHALSFVTPDAQRTFSVHLGAALHLTKEDIIEEDIQQSKIIHFEGYQLEGDTHRAVMHAMQLAKKHQTLISLDIADPGVVRRNLAQLRLIAKNHVDILFANEQEAFEFTGLNAEEAIVDLGTYAKIAILKLGERGSLLSYKHKIQKIKPFPAKAIDTSGAGDMYAAGLLYGHCQNWPHEKSAALGSLLASKIVEKRGVSLQHLQAEELKKMVQEH